MRSSPIKHKFKEHVEKCAILIYYWLKIYYSETIDDIIKANAKKQIK